jgi:hypothetical protein
VRLTQHFSNTYILGIIMGLGFCLYTTLMWITKLDTIYLNIGRHFDKAIIIWPITVILFAIYRENKKTGIPIPKRIAVAVIVSLISFVVYNPFLYVYHHFINPDWFESVIALEAQKLISQNADTAFINDQIQKMRDSNLTQDGMFRLSALVPTVIVIPTFLALLSGIFIRKQKR